MAGPCSGLSPWARAPASGLVQRSSRPWRRSDSVLVTASSQSDTPRFPSHPPPQPHLQQPTVAHRAASISAAAVLALGGMLELAPPADAVLVSPNAAIARSADAALRRSIPAVNRNVKVIQDRLEEVQYLLRIPQVRLCGRGGPLQPRTRRLRRCDPRGVSLARTPRSASPTGPCPATWTRPWPCSRRGRPCWTARRCRPGPRCTVLCLEQRAGPCSPVLLVACCVSSAARPPSACFALLAGRGRAGRAVRQPAAPASLHQVSPSISASARQHRGAPDAAWRSLPAR